MEKFRVIIYAEDYDLGTDVVVQNVTSLMDIFKSFFEKLKLPIPNQKIPIFAAKSKWKYALGSILEDLGEFHDDDLIILSLWKQDN